MAKDLMKPITQTTSSRPTSIHKITGVMLGLVIAIIIILKIVEDFSEISKAFFGIFN